MSSFVIDQSNVVQPRTQNDIAATRTWFLERGLFSHNSWPGASPGFVWASFTRNDSLFVLDLTKMRDIFVTHGDDIARPAGWDGGIGMVRAADFTGSGRTMLVTVVTAGFDLRPRGIFAIEPDSGLIRWSYRCGPSPTVWDFRDVDDDGVAEILCGMSALGNGNADNGTTDVLSYAVLLGADGEPRWTQQLGRFSSSTWVCFLKTHGVSRRVVCAGEYGGPVGARERDSLFLLDACSGAVLLRTSLGGFNKGYVRTVDRKGQERVCVAGADDTLRLLDDQLRVIRKVKGAGSSEFGICAGSFSARGRSEIATMTHTGQLMLFDADLRLLSQTYIGSSGSIQPLRYRGRARLLVERADGDFRTWRVYEFNALPLWSRQVTLGLVSAGLAILLCVFGLLMINARYQRTRDVRATIRSLTGQAGLIELNRRGEFTSANSRARDMIAKVLGGAADVKKLPTTGPIGAMLELARSVAAEPEGTAPREMAVSLTPGQTSLVRCIRVKTGVLLTIEDISAVEYLRRVKSWAPVAQKLAHGIKNPLNTILGSVEQIELRVQDDKARKYMGYVKDEVTRLRKMSDAFMRFTRLNPPELEAKDVNEVVRKVLAKFESLLETTGSPQAAEIRGQPETREIAGTAPDFAWRNHRDSPGFPAGTVPGFRSGRIRLKLELDEKLPLVPVDEVGLSSALEILVENAIEAMSPEFSPPRHQDTKKEPGSELQPREHESTNEEEDRVLTIRTSLGIRGQPETREIAGTAPDFAGRNHRDSPGFPAETVPNSRAEDSASSAPSAVSSAGSFVRIEVVDTGRGIPEKYLDKVFEPYFTHGKETGTGLGLALAKKIVEDHKGRIEIESHEGTGTTVRIILPVKA